MRPLTESQGYLDVSSGTSEDFNKLIKAIGYDITTVFNSANTNSTDIDNFISNISMENIFLQKKIYELESKFLSIRDTMSSTDYNYLYKTFYSTDGVEATADAITQDTTYGIITLPTKDSQMAPLAKYPKDFLLKNLDIKATIQAEGGTPMTVDLTTDSDLINIVDGDAGTFWNYSIETDTTANYIDVLITVTMPKKMISSLNVNSIGIQPHPVYSLKLLDITYVDANDSTTYPLPFTYLPNAATREESIGALYSDMGNTKLMFQAIQVSSITFKFRQSYYSQRLDKRKFILGIKNISLEYLRVTAGEASFITTFKIPGEDRHFKRIIKPINIPIDGESDEEGRKYGDAVEHELLYDKSSPIPSLFGSDIAADIDTVYVKTTIKWTGGTIPALKGIKLGYLPKDSTP